MISLLAHKRAAQRRAVETHATALADADLPTVYRDARSRVAAQVRQAREVLAHAATDPERQMAQKRLQMTLIQAVARERSLILGATVVACQRLAATTEWRLVPYPSQIEAALATTDDAIVELATGEGKTLVAAMAASVWALPGAGVHLVTANGYLASRDAQWMKPLYELLGLTVASLDVTQPWSSERRAAYLADVTYASVSEVGFDYLRDHTAPNADARVQRAAWGCLVDEADAVLIDDAGTPLILSGPSSDAGNVEVMREADVIARSLWVEQERRVQHLVDAAIEAWNGGDVDAAAETMAVVLRGNARHPAAIRALASTPGLAAVVEPRAQAKNTVERIGLHQADLLLVVDVESRTAATTELGQSWLPEAWRDMATSQGEIRHHALMQAIRAHALFERDRDYLVDADTVSIIDPRTGRVLKGRRWSEGLHQAIEVKEGVGDQAETRTVARCTIQDYFQRYSRLAGMTGTAKDASMEFATVYGCRVVHIPPNKPSRRVDAPDMLFPTAGDRVRGLVRQTLRLHALDLPVIIVASSVRAAEEIETHMTAAGLKVDLLTARIPSEEAAIIARAGRAGAVTVTTAMAGRGTDIVVSPETLVSRDAAWCAAHGQDERLLLDATGQVGTEIGGLHVLALGRWGSRRVDRQLKGRAGRQGEPGWTQTLVATDDPLVLESGVSRTLALLERLGALTPEGATSTTVMRLLERAQRALAVRDTEGRQRMAAGDAWLNIQRDMVYGLRDLLLEDPEEAADWVHMAITEGVEVLRQRAEPAALAQDAQNDAVSDVATDISEAPGDEQEIARRQEEAQGLLATLGESPMETLARDEALMRQAYGDVVIQQMACAALDLWWGEHLAWYDAARASGVHQGAAGGADVLQVLAGRLDEAFEAGRQDICVQMVQWLEEKASAAAGRAVMLSTTSTDAASGVAGSSAAQVVVEAMNE